MRDIFYVPIEKIKEIQWNGDYKEYDYELFRLGEDYDEFIVVNPLFEFYKSIELPQTSNQCIVWMYKDTWVAKYFNKHWAVDRRYTEVDLKIVWERNPEISSNIVFDSDPASLPVIDLYDLNYEMVWYVDPKLADSKVWLYKGKLSNCFTHGTKDMGYISISNANQLDVIFISYNEPNAEENWRRVLEKSPKAYRVNGVNGIVNAHKCAAELSTTDMFYVVDGDAYLTDNWDFTYQPSIFDRDCVHVWRSCNPINGLKYGYGGVKLFPRELTLNVDSACVDLTTSISPKFKLMDKVSNITKFNTDEFNTWRSAFRECAKLASNILERNLAEESEKRLNIWCTVGAEKPFGDWAIKGANAGKDFGGKNKHNSTNLLLINDSNWIKLEFLKIYN